MLTSVYLGIIGIDKLELAERSVVIRVLISLCLWSSGTLVLTIMGLIYLLTTLIIPPRYLHSLLRKTSWLILRASGQCLRIHGPLPDPKGRPYIYIFNHCSILDAFIVCAVVPEYCRAIGKIEQFSWPFWGTIIRRYGVIPVERDRLKPALASLELAQTYIAARQSLIIAPEGTRSPDGKLQTFKKGAFHMAKNTKASLIPLGFRGAYQAKHKGSWVITPGRIDAYIGTPISPEIYSEMTVDQLRDYAFGQVKRLAGQ